MELTSAKQMRNADDTAIHVLGIPSSLLMRNAARALARAAIEMMGQNRSAVIFCGSGNNGGDGVACASYMLLRGVEVRVLLVGSREKMTDDTREMERRFGELGGELEIFDPLESGLAEGLDSVGVIVDALFGVGLSRDIEGTALEAVRLMNSAKAPVIAADIPSGVDADTGKIMGEAVRCEKTVTFSMAKPGHFIEPGCIYCGEITIADIGIPPEVLKNCGCGVYAVSKEDISLPPRPRLSHKGDFGKLLVISGSVGYTGAPTLCAKAAERSGAGLVYLGVPRDIYEITAVKNDGAMPFPLSCDNEGKISIAALPKINERLGKCDICVIGPGVGRSDELSSLVSEVISSAQCRLVLDADALFAAAQDTSVLKKAKYPPVLTPHEGEFVRLNGAGITDRISDARRFSQENNCILVLKGHRTLIAFPDSDVFILQTGGPGMAKGGSGDVLSGVIGAMLGQMPLKEAVLSAVWIHGRAGDICAQELGEYSVTPSDIISALPKSIKQILR